MFAWTVIEQDVLEMLDPDKWMSIATIRDELLEDKEMQGAWIAKAGYPWHWLVRKHLMALVEQGLASRHILHDGNRHTEMFRAITKKKCRCKSCACKNKKPHRNAFSC